MRITKTQQTLLGVLSQVLTGKEYEIPADTDWADLYAQCKAQAVAPMVFSCIAEKCSDPEVFSKWRAFTMRAFQNNMNVHIQHGTLHRLMTEHGISYCVIKGCASAKDYKDPLLRAMGDVDFLVSEADWDRAKQVLLADGFEADEEHQSFHLPFYKKNFEMEMHHEPFGLKGEKAEQLQSVVPELIEKSVEVNTGLSTFRMPDAFGHGIVILIHAYRHLQDYGIGVRHLCDWAAFISGFSDEEFREIFERRFQELGLWKLTQVFSMTAHRYLSIPYQSWMGPIDEEMCEMLMLDIFDGGNFGRGNGARLNQNQALYSDNQQLSQTGGMLQLMKTLNQQAKEHYPRAMKCALLRPFGWFALGVRYVFRVATGKRQKVPAETMKMVALRRKLYQQLGVFDEL